VGSAEVPYLRTGSEAVAGVPDLRDTRVPRAARVSVVVPTRNEAGNVEALLERLGPALAGRDSEVIFVDDSDDETPDLVRRRAADRPHGLTVRLVHRAPGRRAGGLGTAVVAGIRAAEGDWVVVMDGDLQHPPEVVPQLIAAGERCDAGLVLASRHVDGGASEGLAGPARILVSGGATLLAKALFPVRLRGVSDPMSGFFAVRRSAVDPGTLQPDGFKILLEILVRTPGLRRIEVGFEFRDRNAGQSKASLAQGASFARHLARLSLSRLAPSNRTT
jgi:dolichol-phosphate mannosyltransferase